MAICSAEIKGLEKLYESFKGQLPELEKELERLVKADDENMILLYSRRCLEVIITDLCECELKRPRKTEPLKGIIDKLHKEEKVPSHIISSMHGLNELSTYGAHPKDFDPRQVRTTLINLDTIIEWYMKHKEGGVEVVTRSAEKIRQEVKSTEEAKIRIQIPRKRLISYIAGSILIIVIVVAVLFFTNIIGGGKEIQKNDKSIAVLPFKSLSDDPDKQYLADGMMDAILLHLSKIEDLRVMSRTSVEQYRKTDKTLNVIGKELDVAYLLEGSFQKYGDNARLIVQLIKTGKEGHVWANDYDRNWNSVFSVQSEVAQNIAKELHALITPEEKQLIEKTPTTSLTAYDFYQIGREELTKYQSDSRNKTALQKADDLFHKALKYDTTFAQAYIGLAWVYWNKHSSVNEYYSENYADSVLILCNIALSFDNKLAEAYIVRGEYYRYKGIIDKAGEDFDKALKINPNSWEVYTNKGHIYSNDDFVNSIDNYQKAASLNHGSILPNLLRTISWQYGNVGFKDKAQYYNLEALKLDNDSALYFSYLGSFEDKQGNYETAIEFLRKGYAIDSTRRLISLGYVYYFLGQFKESLKYYKKFVEQLKALGRFNNTDMHRIGYAYWANGYKKEAEYYFDKQLEYSKNEIKFSRGYGQGLYPYYDIAGIYAFRGDKVKAYENLKLFNQRQRMPIWFVHQIKNEPLFNSIRNEPEFQQIVRDVEAKYQAEHERVRKWLEEKGMLYN